jgi:prepilin peptidase CpaA
MLEVLIFVVFPFCMLFAAISDAVSMTIANRLSLVLAGAFFVIAPFTGMAASEIGLHLAAGAAVLVVTFGLFALGGMGGGDAKLLAATSVWMGFNACLMKYVVVSALIGGLLTVAILIYRKSALADFTRNSPVLRHFANEAAGVPYGIALGLGGLIAYPDSPLMLWALARFSS